MNFFTGLSLEKKEYVRLQDRLIHYIWKNSSNEKMFYAGARTSYIDYAEVSYVWIDVYNFRRFYLYDSEKDTLPQGMSSFMEILEDEEYLSHRLYDEFTPFILKEIERNCKYLSLLNVDFENEDVKVFCDFIINQMSKEALENLLVKVDKKLEYL